MLPKGIFFLRLMFLNPLRLVPSARPLLLRAVGAGQPEEGVLNVSALLNLGASRYGRAGLWLGALAMYLPGLVLMLAGPRLPLQRELLNAAAAVFCVFRFDVFRPPEPLSLLPFAYLVLAACFHFFWPLTYLFLAAFSLLTRNLPRGGSHFGSFL